MRATEVRGDCKHGTLRPWLHLKLPPMWSDTLSPRRSRHVVCDWNSKNTIELTSLLKDVE